MESPVWGLKPTAPEVHLCWPRAALTMLAWRCRRLSKLETDFEEGDATEVDVAGADAAGAVPWTIVRWCPRKLRLEVV
ncbi:hypothetical protein PC114_g15233 [Phytophthora cactorum]|uniref:Uncharacterized protein n=1 Tax=Phytophthora cactorum TaxID=29920 RepID=A0A8T1C1Y2_9STRA|nr:hypothetical protein PC112_g24163 [Phytophthora cactorum]KAG2896114.1 hypothetical protein PC114_g15233 [Phytophthora cactorum]KAG2910913.1 hypothetical protein PC117_g19262 [Phytophthora cactorum]KAG3170242.1 hypothetical protein PC128_g18956 [Phytophthora cactorum]